MSDKLCKDCRHRGYGNACKAPQSVCFVDTSTGKRYSIDTRCEIQRGFINPKSSHICGREGRFFEPKVTIWAMIKALFSKGVKC